MYADDTKIWREIINEDDHLVLQRDIDFLMDWALQNSMNFHPSKCKALMVNKSKLPLLNILPFVQFHYAMRINPIDIEKDLGVNINGSSNFTFHTDMLYSKANPRFAILKRTCHFVYNIYRKRAIFSTMVRCIFEHRPYAWRPSSASSINLLINWKVSKNYELNGYLVMQIIIQK